MDPLLLPTPEPDNWIERFAESLHDECRRAREFYASTYSRIEQAADTLERRLQRLEQPSEELGTTTNGDEDFRRRYEMALDDLRDLKQKYADLQRRTTQSRPQQPAPNGGQITDWEAEKRRVLNALDSDSERDEQAVQDTRWQSEAVPQPTDAAWADDAPIASDQTAVEQVLDANAAIRRERERLKQMQADLLEKLRQAEIELSRERANIARERAEFERRAKSDSTHNSLDENFDEAIEQPSSGRWLTRLGLTEADREQRRRRR